MYIVCFASLIQDYNEIDKGMNDLKNEIELQKKINLTQDCFCSFMTSFINKNSAEFQEIQNKRKTIETLFPETLAFFGEDPHNPAPENVLGIFATFIKSLEVKTTVFMCIDIVRKQKKKLKRKVCCPRKTRLSSR